MRKGIVMGIDDSYVTLLTPDGEFLRAQKQDLNYSIGDEIHFFPITEPTYSNLLPNIGKFLKRKSVIVSMASLLICVGSVIPVYQSNKAYAYMSIDMDSSIELCLNKKMQVVAITGYNRETEAFISKLENWEKRDVSEVTSVILDELKEEGLISKEEPVSISTVKTKKLDDKETSKLKKNIEEIKQSVDSQNVEVKIFTTTKKELKEARNLGVSVGKYHRNKNESTTKKQNIENKESSQATSTTKSTLIAKKQNKNTANSQTKSIAVPSVKVEKQEANNNGQEKITKENRKNYRQKNAIENIRSSAQQQQQKNKKKITQKAKEIVKVNEKVKPENDQKKTNKKTRQVIKKKLNEKR